MGTESKISYFATKPFSNENTRLMRTLWTRQMIPGSALMGVEQTQYFPGGSSAVHSDDRSEEIIYFRHGHGEVQLDNEVVQVGPGSAVAIPKNVVHCVRNTGKDVLEHILATGDLNIGATPDSTMRESLSYKVKNDRDGLDRLSLFLLEISKDEEVDSLSMVGRECVYVLSSGTVVATVETHDCQYDFEYLINTSNSLWVPPKTKHAFRNISDVPAVILGFECVSK